jgi:hypothetical protein
MMAYGFGRGGKVLRQLGHSIPSTMLVNPMIETATFTFYYYGTGNILLLPPE